MSLRFRRRIRIFPGIYLNIGKTGISASICQRGANLNFGKRGVFLNTGIPGTGLSYRTRIPGQKGEVPPSRGKPSGALGIIPQDSEETIRVNVPPPLHDAPAKSSTANINTGDAFLAVLAQIDQAREQQKNLLKQIDQTKGHIQKLRDELTRIRSNPILWLIKGNSQTSKIELNIERTKTHLLDLESALRESKVKLDLDLDEVLELKFLEVVETFSKLARSVKIWDVITVTRPHEKAKNSGAKSLVDRVEVGLSFKDLDFVESSITPMLFR